MRDLVVRKQVVPIIWRGTAYHKLFQVGLLQFFSVSCTTFQTAAHNADATFYNIVHAVSLNRCPADFF